MKVLQRAEVASHQIAYLGSSLEEGPVPTLLYFALSEEESLDVDPYNQPVRSWLELWQKQGKRARAISFSLPYHGPDLPAVEALTRWAEAFARGEDPLAPFLDSCEVIISSLLNEQLIDPATTLLAGLSRGALIAAHLLARMPQLKQLVGFAPLTSLMLAKEFAELPSGDYLKRYNVAELIPQLLHRKICLFIGNHDTRVSTRAVCSLVCDLAEAAYEARVRSPHIELKLYPSIGHQGHGTPLTIFVAGMEWGVARSHS